MRKLLFNYSLYSHPEILGCDKSTPLKRNLVPGFEERRNKEEGDKQEHCCRGR
jgi:hypothetical protein